MNFPSVFVALVLSLLCFMSVSSPASAQDQPNVVQINSVEQLVHHSAQSGQTLKMTPGVYRMTDYLTDAVIAQIRRDVTGEGRRPVWMMRLSGNNNRYDLRGVTLEIDTTLYRKLPGGYMRCLFITGNGNTFDGLTIRNTGPNQGSGGNILSVWGDGNTLENFTLSIFGSFPYGYGDLLGKGGPNLVGLQKQSGIMIGGDNTTLRRCRVISRALGHCFYVQGGDNTLIEDCYAEGEMRSTSEMLRDTSGPAFDKNFRSVYENRDGRYQITPGYTKSLVEDGFRTYGGGGAKGARTGKVTLLNCTALNTRAGFEISGQETGDTKTTLQNCQAVGCERAYLLGSNVIVRGSRGDIAYGPLLYLRGGQGSDVELELNGQTSNSTVHALATIAGANHRVRFYTLNPGSKISNLPIMLGFDMPKHAEMSSPILPASASKITLINELPHLRIIQSEVATDCLLETSGPVLKDADTKKSP